MSQEGVHVPRIICGAYTRSKYCYRNRTHRRVRPFALAKSGQINVYANPSWAWRQSEAVPAPPLLGLTLAAGSSYDDARTRFFIQTFQPANRIKCAPNQFNGHRTATRQ